MWTGSWVLIFSLFVLGASCYLLFILSDPLEEVGGKLGKLLRLPEDVIASTFQALATSGPEIIMAILAATAFIGAAMWEGLAFGERASAGALNMCFSAMDNLVGIGCLGAWVMLRRGTVQPDEVVEVERSVWIGLGFYLVSSTCLCLFILDGSIGLVEAWVLMAIGILFIISQFFLPKLLNGYRNGDPNGDADAEIPEIGPVTLRAWGTSLTVQSFSYLFLVFGLVLFVRECLGATFDMATLGIASVGGVLILFTSYVSSFPELMLTYRFAIADKKDALLGMLFGSNVIDLAFAGFRPIWTGEDMPVFTTGRYPELLPVFLWCLPVVAGLSLLVMWRGSLKYKHAKPLMGFYLVYILGGFFLL